MSCPPRSRRNYACCKRRKFGAWRTGDKPIAHCDARRNTNVHRLHSVEVVIKPKAQDVVGEMRVPGRRSTEDRIKAGAVERA